LSISAVRHSAKGFSVLIGDAARSRHCRAGGANLNRIAPPPLSSAKGGFAVADDALALPLSFGSGRAFLFTATTKSKA
jgi:hypothetical protein